MKLLQIIITFLQSVSNVQRASSGSGNPAGVVDQTAHTLSKQIDVIHKHESQNPFSKGETGSGHTFPKSVSGYTGFKTELYSLFGIRGGPQDSCQRDVLAFLVVGSALGGGGIENGKMVVSPVEESTRLLCLYVNEIIWSDAKLNLTGGDTDHDTDHENEHNEYRVRVPVGRHRQPNHPVRVRTFDGKRSWGAYYLQFSRIAARNGCGEVDKLDKLIDSLRDKALEYLSLLNGATQNSLERLVEAMECHFGGQVDKVVAR